jgi:DNA-binding transcriptional MerR regulator
MAKSPDAFRTISEVAEWLGVQAHVLRFWESKFSQVKPIKRAGGRRYYRPNDMLLLGGIKQLLHEDGLTIKGVQKVLREEGMSHVAALSPPLDEATLSQVAEAAPAPEAEAEPPPAPMIEGAEEERGIVLNFDKREPREASPPPPAEAPAPVPPAAAPPPEPPAAAPDPEPTPEPAPEMPRPPQAPESAPAEPPVAGEAALPTFLRRPLEGAPPAESDNPPAEESPAAESAAGTGESATPPAVTSPPKPRPRRIDVGPLRTEDSFQADPGVLSAAYGLRRLGKDRAEALAPLLARLRSLRADQAAQGGGTPAGTKD